MSRLLLRRQLKEIDPGVAHQRAGKTNLVTLNVGELLGALRENVGNAEVLAHGEYAGLDGFAVEAGDPERIGDVLESRLVGHQRSRAEDRRRFPNPLPLPEHLLAVDQNGTALRLLDPGDDLECRETARFLVAQDRGNAARRRLHAQLVEDDAPVVPAIDFTQFKLGHRSPH